MQISTLPELDYKSNSGKFQISNGGQSPAPSERKIQNPFGIWFLEFPKKNYL